ncbi:MAG: hypothetical protein ACOC5K_04605 [Chloroflexota bacterium]
MLRKFMLPVLGLAAIAAAAFGGVVMATGGDGDSGNTHPAARAAKADMADRLGVSPDDIELVEKVSKEWPDAALGVPDEDRMYAQVVTPGYQIVLRTSEQTGEGAKEYTYHTDEAGDVVKLAETTG